MKLARVLGSVVATAKHPAYAGHKLMLVAPEPTGKAFLAIDNAQAGPGDRVLVLTEGTGVRQVLGTEAGPIRSLIVGIVDAVEAR
jgi:microcompartment protein CcmK/EutM